MGARRPGGAGCDLDGGRASREGRDALRCWDAELASWRVVFMSPGDGQFVTFVGRRDGDRIVQEIISRPADAPAERWTFTEISDIAFPCRA
jgi:hypothetical protein